MTPLVPLPFLERAHIHRIDVIRACGLFDIDAVRLRPAPGWMQRLWRGTVSAMTLGGTIFVHPRLLRASEQVSPGLLLHELVHVRQWQRLGKLRFSARYLGEYLHGRSRSLSHSQAYSNISFEREARAVERIVSPTTDR